MKTPREIISIFKKEEIFLLATHVHPDGDAIGSVLALSFALESLGKQVFVFNKDSIPPAYRFMPGHKKFRLNVRSIIEKKPVLILLDCNAPERAALERYSFRKSVVIDHHKTEKDFGDIRWVVPEAAATGLMIFHLIKSLGVSLSKETAFNLYTAISADTGTFRYSNTSSDVLRASAELIDAGADPAIISESLYNHWQKNRFELFLQTLNNLEIKNNLAFMYITEEMFKKTKTLPEDAENFSNFPRMIKGIKISALFRETGDGSWKVSLRSKGNVDVAKTAERFGGGGHRNAAGFHIKGSLDSAKAKLFAAAKRSVRS
jgi:bifunctional oligoribonuclease and PAP phosphatase NrnA